MAKGTLHATATTTKKGGVSRASAKTGKAAVVGSQGSSSSGTTKSTSTAPASKKSKTGAASSRKIGKKEQKPATSEESDNDDVFFVETEAKDGPRHLNVKGKQYDKHYKAVLRDSLEGMPLLYPDEQDKIETILKLFDLDPEYGPAAGMTRLERWKRAANWGLDPPKEVYDILTTIEGASKEKYRESLFHGRV